MEVFTIGFAQKSAADFFGALKTARIRRRLDVRLNNSSQLAGFTKKADLAFFLDAISGIEYVHQPLLAPTQELLDAYKKNGGAWRTYETGFLDLMRQRRIESNLNRSLFSVPSVLLCSEPTAEHCHRRLVLEYLNEKWGGLKIRHL